MYRYIVAAGVCRERDELVALLNARERQCFETLSSVGQKTEASDYSKHCKDATDTAASSDITTVKVYVDSFVV